MLIRSIFPRSKMKIKFKLMYLRNINISRSNNLYRCIPYVSDFSRYDDISQYVAKVRNSIVPTIIIVNLTDLLMFHIVIFRFIFTSVDISAQIYEETYTSMYTSEDICSRRYTYSQWLCTRRIGHPQRSVYLIRFSTSTAALRHR